MDVQLPSGNTVVLRDRLNNADRRAYVKSMEEGPREEVVLRVPVIDPSTGEQKIGPDGVPEVEEKIGKEPTWLGSMDVSNVMLGLLIESWTFDFAIPKVHERGVDVLDDLIDLDDYDAIAEAARPVVRKLFVNANPTTDKEAPTGPSSE